MSTNIYERGAYWSRKLQACQLNFIICKILDSITDKYTNTFSSFKIGWFAVLCFSVSFSTCHYLLNSHWMMDARRQQWNFSCLILQLVPSLDGLGNSFDLFEVHFNDNIPLKQRASAILPLKGYCLPCCPCTETVSDVFFFCFPPEELSHLFDVRLGNKATNEAVLRLITVNVSFLHYAPFGMGTAGVAAAARIFVEDRTTLRSEKFK